TQHLVRLRRGLGQPDSDPTLRAVHVDKLVLRLYQSLFFHDVEMVADHSRMDLERLRYLLDELRLLRFLQILQDLPSRGLKEHSCGAVSDEVQFRMPIGPRLFEYSGRWSRYRDDVSDV